MLRRRLAECLAVFLLAATPAVAQVPPAQPPQMAPAALTPQIVGSFIQSYPKVRATADGLSQRYGVKSDSANPASGMAAFMAYGAAKGELDIATRPFGFTDFTGWLQVFVSVTNAYIFARDGGAMDARMATAIAQIENNKNLTPAQKQMMLQQMQASSAAMASMRPPQQNIDAVAPHAAALAQLFKDDRR